MTEQPKAKWAGGLYTIPPAVSGPPLTQLFDQRGNLIAQVPPYHAAAVRAALERYELEQRRLGAGVPVHDGANPLAAEGGRVVADWVYQGPPLPPEAARWVEYHQGKKREAEAELRAERNYHQLAEAEALGQIAALKARLVGAEAHLRALADALQGHGQGT